MNSLPIVAFVVVALVVLATQIFKILNEYERGVLFRLGKVHAVNVLEDPAVREGIKEYSSWPTIHPPACG